MLYGLHVIFSTYGFWLPNDPRGSWSDWIRKWELLCYGPATKVSTRQSVATKAHNRALRRKAKQSLAYPEVKLNGRQAQAVAIGLSVAIAEGKYCIHACSIMPQHVHLVVGPLDRDISRVVGHLKARASQQLKRNGIHPLAAFEKEGVIPSPRARNSWIVFVFSKQHLGDAITYVDENPLKEGKPPQNWSFITPYVSTPTRSKLRR